MTDELIIAGNTYGSHLLVDAGKYKDFKETREAFLAGRMAKNYTRQVQGSPTAGMID